MKKTIERLALLLLFLMPLATVAKDFYGTINDSGTVTFYYDDNMASSDVFYQNAHWTDISRKDNVRKVVFDSSIKDFHPESAFFNYFFMDLHYLKSIENLDYLDTRRLTDMTQMFYECWNLEELDLSSFDMQNVTKMKSMFEGCTNLQKVNLQFKTQTVKLTTMERMFSKCTSLTSVDMDWFDTKNVTTMAYMFYGCTALEKVTNMYFDAQSAPDLKFMFRGCKRLKEIDLSNFSNTQNITHMTRMFEECSLLKTVNLTNFVINKTDTVYVADMFANCKTLTTIYCNEDWTEGTLIDQGQPPFSDCNALVGGCGSMGLSYTSAAHPDVSGRPGAFTATEGLFFNGRRLTKDNAQSFATVGTMSYNPEEGIVTLEDATIISDGGFYSPTDETLWLNLNGTSTIKTKGNAFQVYEVFPTAMTSHRSLTINSLEGYGILLKGDGTFSGRENLTGQLCYIYIQGKRGAIHGEKAYSKWHGSEVYPKLYPENMVLALSSNGTKPAVSGLREIAESDIAYNYWNYYFDEDRMTVVDGSTLDDEAEPLEVTKPFKIVPKDKLSNYNIELGGKYLNLYNETDFNPMSLSEGKVYMSGSALIMENAKFKTHYIPTDENHALNVKNNQFILYIEGDNDLVGTSDDYDYGIRFVENEKNTTINRAWTIRSHTGSRASLKLTGEIYCRSTEYDDAKLYFKDVDVTVADRAYVWQEDHVIFNINNSSLDLIDIAWPTQPIMECLEGLELTNCYFADGCYWNSAKGCVNDRSGQPATGRVRILCSGGKKGDVNGDGKVNTADVVAVYSFIEKGTASGVTRDAANVNGDSAVNTADVVAIYDIIIKGS